MPALIEDDKQTTNGNGTSAPPSSFDVSIIKGVAIVELSKGRQNSFDRSREQELTQLIKQLGTDDDVGCLILTGGKGRSFNVGPDYDETVTFTSDEEIDQWTNDLTDLFCTIADISKPVIAAIDGSATGLGLQIALCCDYRIGSDSCQLAMPELRMGSAANFGAYLVEAVAGRAVMQRMLFSSEGWDFQSALRDGLLHEVVTVGNVLDRAIERANILKSWPTAAVRATRPAINAAFTNGLATLGEQAKISHRSVLAAGSAHANTERGIVKQPVASPTWILLTSAPVPSLSKALLRITSAGIHVYGQGAATSSPYFVWQEEDAKLQAFSPWVSFFEVRGELVRVGTGVLNDPPFFMVGNTVSRAWALGTDPYMLNFTRLEWGMPVGFACPTTVNYDETTSFLGVRELPFCLDIELRKHVASWNMTTKQLHDPVYTMIFNPSINDFHEAGTVFVSALERSVAECARPDEPVAVLLSGGIDSGALAAFAVRAGQKVTAYSAGTPWGNEHKQSKELADWLGIPWVSFEVTLDDFLAAIPETIRAIGTAERERVDIAVTITAVLRSGFIKEPHVFTGLGSDLLQFGMPLKADGMQYLQRDLFEDMTGFRYCSGFTDYVARTKGKKLSHPYWRREVIEAGLNIHPTCKFGSGREKAHFRTAMERYVPKATAWRTKIIIELGGDYQGGFDLIFGGRDKKVAAFRAILEAVTKTINNDPFANVEHLVKMFKQVDGVYHIEQLS